MKTVWKRALAMLLVVVMVCGFAPVGALTEMDWLTVRANAESYSGTCGDHLTWELDTETGVLSISGTGSMYDYFYYNAPWEPYRSDIQAVEITDDVTRIGNCAFIYCENLTSITIPDSVTEIGNNAFDNCPLEYVKMGAGLTSIPSTLIHRDSLKEFIIGECVSSIESGAFRNCVKLTNNITIPNSVINIGSYAFENCANLMGVMIGQGVKSIGYDVFRNCACLKGVVFNAVDCTSDNRVFSGCSTLSYVFIGDDVKTIPAYFFENCTNISIIELPSSVISIGNYAFRDCTGLVSVIINGQTSIGNSSFRGCTNLKAVTLGSNATNIDPFAFDNCTSLTSIRIPKSVTNIEWSAFNGCTGLTEINVDNNNPAYSSDAYGVLYNKDKTTLIQYPAGNRRSTFAIPSSVTCITNYAFRYSTNLTSIDIDHTMRLIKSAAFGGCSNLREVRYHGTEVQWSTMQIEINNDEFVLAKRVYCPDEPVPSDGTPVTIIYKQNKTLTANCPVVWASSDPRIAEVDPNTGTVQTHKTGVCRIIGTDTDTGGIAIIYNVTVKYVWWQWLIRIFLLGFIWY